MTEVKSDRNYAQNVHAKRINKFRANKVRSSENQGNRVDESIKTLVSKYPTINAEDVNSFKDLPLSTYTQQGLEDAKFQTPTDIQRQSIGLALQGRDILGAAKTGSGKTLAFLIPVLELLYRNKVDFLDGMSALVVSPTRELAYQTYSVLKKIGGKHNFSAGLVIGGKNLKEEKERISRTHIVVCTPGRLQQHMEQTWGFNADNLQILVLDECDRILDMGFEDTMNAILEYLPQERQTLMFSATQTKSVKDLARVGLKSPHYISVHENSEQSTPTTLEQSYLVCELQNKLDTLWFFIKNHLKYKILVFVQTAKQVRYMHDSFQRIRAGTTLLSLYGTMKQVKRVKTYEEFCRKQNVVLFATDVAARGLDFPGVNWVIQYDAPDDADTYIHRVGRTARYDSDGEALIFLLPSEKQEMLKLLGGKKIPIEEIKVNPKKVGSIQRKLASQLVEDPELKEFAKACFIAYVKGYFLMSNKAMFNITKLQMEAFAQSLGLVLAPRIRFLQKHEKIQKEKEKRALEMARLEAKQNGGDADESTSDQSDESGSDQSDEEDYGRSVAKAEYVSESEEEEGSQSETTTSDEDDVTGGLLTLKSTSSKVPEKPKLTLQQELELKSKTKNRAISKRDLAVAMKKKGLGAKRTVFSGDDESSDDGEDMEEEGNILDLDAARRRLCEEDKIDKETYRARIKRKHQERRWKANEERRAAKKAKTEQDDSDSDTEVVAVLGKASDEESEPDTDQPEADQSDTDQPEAGQSDTDQSEVDQSDSEESVQSDSDTADPNTYSGSYNTIDDDEAFALQLLKGGSK